VTESATRTRDLALAVLRRNRFLQAAMVAALIGYGGVCALLIWQDPSGPRLEAGMAAWLVGLSLATWSLLFWWLPVLARTDRELRARGAGPEIARLLEIVATFCIVVVHALLLVIVLHRASA
jgi:hypothetical protein